MAMSTQTRREFLENSMFAAAAIAGSASVVPAAAAAGSASPNERLRVAILGVKNRGKLHLSEFMKRKDCEIVAIVDPDEFFGNQHGVQPVLKATGKKPAFYRDMRKAFDDQSIDIVSIATPNHWHSLAAIWAMQAGKDVYVEKPVSHNVSEGRRVVQTARRHKRVCQAGTQIRSMSGARALIEFVQSGGVGEVKLARGLCYKPRGSIGPRGNYDVPASVDYNLWLGPAPQKPLSRRRFHYDWHWQWDYGNGDLGNQGIHQMDVGRWGLGVSGIGDSVVAYGGRLSYVDAGETANTQVCIHSFGDKTLVFETRGLKTGSYRGTKIGDIFYGSDGYVVLSSYTGGAAFDLKGKMIKSFSGGRTSDHFANFIEAVRSRKTKLNGDIEEGHLSSALCHLGNVSYRLGDRISAKEVERRLSGNDEALETWERTASHLADNQLDLAKVRIGFGRKLAINGETFTGEFAEQANLMLTRNYRKPFVVPDENDV
jgi:predicted dehydrogenase